MLTGKTTVVSALNELFLLISVRRRRAIVPLITLMLLGAMAEVITIGAIGPFLAIIANPGGTSKLGIATPILDFLGGDPALTVYIGTCLFALAAVIAATLRLLILWFSQSFVNGVSYELAVRVFANALHEPYTFHIRRNSSEIIAASKKVQFVTYDVLMPLIGGAAAGIIAVAIVAALIAIDPIVALIAGVGITLIYLASTATTRSRLRRNSRLISRAEDRCVKIMQEGLGGIRDVLIDHSQQVFIETFEHAEADFRDARTRNAFFSNAPRFVVEAAGMVLIAVLAVAVAGRPGGLLEAIPILGALALGAHKLLPLIQQVYNGWAQTMGNREVLIDLMVFLRRPVSPPAAVIAALPFNKAISLHKVGYAYAGGRRSALRGVSLEIPKGARVGIVGRTGSGKSTLIDLVLGLLEPTEGEIRIDGVTLTAKNRAAWQRNIAHVPQSIYLADDNIAENIAFGVRSKSIDHERVRLAAERAELAEVIAGLPNGYETRVGERGIQLSGGQRQRLGIARALYKQAGVLVFDEATSNLDTETERAVMEAIARLDPELTIFIIAHRLSTLDGCDMIVRLEGGKIIQKQVSEPPIGGINTVTHT